FAPEALCCLRASPGGARVRWAQSTSGAGDGASPCAGDVEGDGVRLRRLSGRTYAVDCHAGAPPCTRAACASFIHAGAPPCTRAGGPAPALLHHPRQGLRPWTRKGTRTPLVCPLSCLSTPAVRLKRTARCAAAHQPLITATLGVAAHQSVPGARVSVYEGMTTGGLREA